MAGVLHHCLTGRRETELKGSGSAAAGPWGMRNFKAQVQIPGVPSA